VNDVLGNFIQFVIRSHPGFRKEGDNSGVFPCRRGLRPQGFGSQALGNLQCLGWFESRFNQLFAVVERPAQMTLMPNLISRWEFGSLIRLTASG